jgi:3-oxoacyl-[acyl-carrier-protein] synthase III
MKEVFITGLGKYLPGGPIPNDEMEEYLGKVNGKSSRLKDKILKSNGIKSRHYAIDKSQNTTISNAAMAAHAVRDAASHANVDLDEVDFLGASTCQGDLPLPGFASMVHGELRIPVCEIATLHGVCVSGMMALKSAYLQVKSGEKKLAAVCASEFPSRLFKSTRFEKQAICREKEGLDFETEFLRWMLSDGAGAAILEPSPSSRGLSLKIDDIRIRSYAHLFSPCMYVGPLKNKTGASIKGGWTIRAIMKQRTQAPSIYAKMWRCWMM